MKKKAPAEKKRVMLMIQVTQEEKDLYRDATEKEGFLGLSTWVRKTLKDRATRVGAKRKQADKEAAE